MDTHYPGSENRSLSAILYGEIGTTEFAKFHKILKHHAQIGDIDYLIRHVVKVNFVNYNLLVNSRFVPYLRIDLINVFDYLVMALNYK